MVSRRKKLLAAGFVLAIGVGLAWPFRRSETPANLDEAPAVSTPIVAVQPRPQTLTGPTELGHEPGAAPPSHPAPLEVSAVGLSLGADPVDPRPLADSDAAMEVVVQRPVLDAAGAHAGLANPGLSEPPPPEAGEERIHVIHNGDSLERLAERYLGDEGRALEIFDLNRGTLENPHWLRIGAELRIPAKTPPSAD